MPTRTSKTETANAIVILWKMASCMRCLRMMDIMAWGDTVLFEDSDMGGMVAEESSALMVDFLSLWGWPGLPPRIHRSSPG
ncbi:hypothetical protein GCM10027277_48670 [Pseudoduganella ginsengisoli]